MNERNLKDLINCDNADKEKMIEAAKETLRWYTFEASEEEFDVAAVDALVRFLREIEPELGVASEGENDKSTHVQKRRVIEWNRGKIAAAVVIGVMTLMLASIIVGNSLGTSMAWEDGGFFKWLQRDKEGQTMITSPEDLGMEDGRKVFFYEMSEVPEKYQHYLIEPNIISGLEEVDLEFVLLYETMAFQRISERLLVRTGGTIECGVTIFEGEARMVRDTYDKYEYQYSTMGSSGTLDIYAKENANAEIEYMLVAYCDNKKFCVSGQQTLDDLIELADVYVYYIFEKNHN